MNFKLTSILVTTVLLAFSLPAQALTLQFNAGLNGANETTPTGSTATGIATLFYDDNNTALTTDDSYNFSLSAFGLSGLVSGMHIHAPAAPGFNGPVVVPLTSPNFLVFNSASSILIGGAGIAPPSSVFLSQLQAGLAYVNLHTVLYPGGEIRGQLIQVAVVPEPSTYAMLLSGLGLIGVFVSRRTQVR
jgi:hypothetical protein